MNRNALFLLICTSLCLPVSNGLGQLNFKTEYADRRLVEITFATDDKPAGQMGHTVVTYWISVKSRGSERNIYDWAIQGEKSPDAETKTKAEECRRRLEGLGQPKLSNINSNQIVTIKYHGTDSTVERKYPVKHVPVQVLWILKEMGFENMGQFDRLKFYSLEDEYFNSQKRE